MEEPNRRSNARYAVSLYTEQVEREDAPPCILNMSETGFLLRGNLCAGSGGVIRAAFKVHPSMGEFRVTARGTVMHAAARDGAYEFGVRIDTFGSEEEETAYRAYVRELAAKTLVL
jgi:hypothetical protein